MTTIVLQNVTQSYGANQVLAPIDLSLTGPSINILMGPSGCGKSTLLRMMGGVRPQKVVTPTSGAITIDGKPCIAQDDDAVTVFQQYSNRPDLNVRQNVEFPFTLGLWKKRFPKAEEKARVDRLIEAVGLSDKQKLYPYELSGGQNQRVALARALALSPKILLMDEPFGALDAYTRKGMQKLLVDLYMQLPCLVVMVTHDASEAIALGDRIIMMGAKPGRILSDQTNGSPETAKTVHASNLLLEQNLINQLAPV